MCVRGSSTTAALLLLVWDLAEPSEVLVCEADDGAAGLGTVIFGDRTPSADCHAILSGLPLYTEPSDITWTRPQRKTVGLRMHTTNLCDIV